MWGECNTRIGPESFSSNENGAMPLVGAGVMLLTFSWEKITYSTVAIRMFEALWPGGSAGHGFCQSACLSQGVDGRDCGAASSS